MHCPNCGYPLSMPGQACPRCQGFGRTQPMDEPRPRGLYAQPAAVQLNGPLIIHLGYDRHRQYTRRLSQIPYFAACIVLFICIAGMLMPRKAGLVTSKSQGESQWLSSMLDPKAPKSGAKKKNVKDSRAKPNLWSVPRYREEPADGITERLAAQYARRQAASQNSDSGQRATGSLSITNPSSSPRTLRLRSDDSSEQFVRIRPGTETTAEVPSGKYSYELIGEEITESGSTGSAVVQKGKDQKLKVESRDGAVTLRNPNR